MNAEQSIVNASVPDQLRAIAHWHDSENPSRMALGAVASCALNYVQELEAEAARLREALNELVRLKDLKEASADQTYWSTRAVSAETMAVWRAMEAEYAVKKEPAWAAARFALNSNPQQTGE